LQVADDIDAVKAAVEQEQVGPNSSPASSAQ
jgi:hypothetical protein